MLKFSLIEFFFRAIPEGFLFVFAGYAFSKKEIQIKPYLLSSVIYSISTFLISLLPVHFGVNTILNMFALIFLIVNINHIDVTKSIKSVIITFIVEFICEGINVYIIQNVFKVNINFIFNDLVLKELYGIPSLVILGLIISLFYLISKRKTLN